MNKLMGKTTINFLGRLTHLPISPHLRETLLTQQSLDKLTRICTRSSSNKRLYAIR